jgi:hypothetical protein
LCEFDETEAVETPARKVAAKKSTAKKAQKKRTMSPEGRKAIGDAVKKRWATKKRSVKKAAP